MLWNASTRFLQKLNKSNISGRRLLFVELQGTQKCSAAFVVVQCQLLWLVLHDTYINCHLYKGQLFYTGIQKRYAIEGSWNLSTLTLKYPFIDGLFEKVMKVSKEGIT